MQLAHHDPLRAVNDKGAPVRHQGQFAYVHFLLPHVEDLAVLHPFFLRIKDHQTNAQFERGGKGHALLQTFAHIVLGRTQRITGKFKNGRTVEVCNGKDAHERGLQPFFRATLRVGLFLQKPLVRTFLHFDEVRNVNRGLNF